MSKKELQVEAITNELAGGASLFFSPTRPKPSVQKPKKSPVAEKVPTKKDTKKTSERMDATPDSTMPPSSRDSKPDSMTSRYHDTMQEIIRKAVKTFGKEVSTHRLTPDEKKAMADIVYAYRGRGIRTSENELSRIAINFLINDYRENGENSLLDKIIRLLHE